jgi:NitT/TauT family transport system permease protein/sulfonate transport system permease protein
MTFCIFWWFVAKDIPDFILPEPLEVLSALFQLAVNLESFQHIAISMFRVTGALIFAAIVSITLAILSRTNYVFTIIIESNILIVLNSFPSIGWAILGVIWFSISDITVIFVEIMIIIPFCLINCIQGFRQVDKEIKEMGISFSRNRILTFFKIDLPLALPFIIAGIRISYGIAWKIAIVAELFGASSGLGWLLQQAQNNADSEKVLAICLLIVLLFSAIDFLLLKPIANKYSINIKES